MILLEATLRYLKCVSGLYSKASEFGRCNNHKYKFPAIFLLEKA